jgi:hypothetical protein
MQLTRDNRELSPNPPASLSGPVGAAGGAAARARARARGRYGRGHARGLALRARVGARTSTEPVNHGRLDGREPVIVILGHNLQLRLELTCITERSPLSQSLSLIETADTHSQIADDGHHDRAVPRSVSHRRSRLLTDTVSVTGRARSSAPDD